MRVRLPLELDVAWLVAAILQGLVEMIEVLQAIETTQINCGPGKDNRQHNYG